jgi:hypothetical protein
MAEIIYGASGGFSVTTSATFEKVVVQGNDGNVAGTVLKFKRTETSTEVIDDETFGAGLCESQDVLNGTIVFSVDEVVIDPSTEETAPEIARTYNPRAEATVTVLGELTGDTFEFDDIEFSVDSRERAATAGDVVKTTVRGTSYGEAGDLTVGDISGGGTTRIEKRFSNTDFLRTVTTTVAFAND